MANCCPATSPKNMHGIISRLFKHKIPRKAKWPSWLEPSPILKKCHTYTNMPKFKTTTKTKPKLQSWSQAFWKGSTNSLDTSYDNIQSYNLLATTLSSSLEDIDFKTNKVRNQGCRPVAKMLSNSRTALNRRWCHLAVILALQRWRQENPKFKATSHYIACLRLSWALRSSFSK